MVRVRFRVRFRVRDGYTMMVIVSCFSRGLFGSLNSKIGDQILDELTYKLSASKSPETVGFVAGLTFSAVDFCNQESFFPSIDSTALSIPHSVQIYMQLTDQ